MTLLCLAGCLIALDNSSADGILVGPLCSVTCTWLDIWSGGLVIIDMGLLGCWVVWISVP